MNKLKVVTIVGTRPEIIRLSMLIPKLDKYTDHVFVHTGQNSDPKLNEVFFQDLELRQPDYYLNVDTSSMGAVMGDTMRKAEEVFLKEKPDAVMILGDTNSAIAAVVAERMHIPVYHMEAGNRSFDNNVPEELNRRMVDHVASFNLPYNDYSMRNLLNEGIHPRRIQKTGSPIAEIYSAYKSKIEASSILQDVKLSKDGYFLVSIHRQENVDLPARLELVLDCLRALRDHFGLPVLVSTHPRTKVRLANLSQENLEGIVFHEPFGYLDYNKLQANAFCVVSDSGTISEEASIIGFPAVSIRDSIERPEALETGAMVLTGLNVANLIQSVELVRDQTAFSTMPEGYEITDFSDRVLKFVFSTVRLHHSWKIERRARRL
jgi:UDP-N-acetylglucosamine 2-epimerase (non-hydrolysing)